MRVLLVEDDQKIASFVIKGLKQEGITADHVTDGESGLYLLTSQEFNLAIVDIMLPGMDGLSMIGELRKTKNSTPVLILSAKQSVDDRVRGLQIGGDDYLVKPFAFSELLARVHALVRRSKGAVEPTRLEVDGLVIDLIKREVSRDGQIIPLQPKEYSLLEYLVRNKGRVISRTMILEHVWGCNFDTQTNVVEVRMSRLREKIDEGFAYPLIYTVRGFGYVLKENA